MLDAFIRYVDANNKYFIEQKKLLNFNSKSPDVRG